MKQHPVYSIFVIFFFFFGCQGEVERHAPNDEVKIPDQNKAVQVAVEVPNQHIAEKAVKDWILANSYDPTNYDAVSFGELDSIIDYEEEVQKINKIIFNEEIYRSEGGQPSNINLDSLKKLVEGAEKEFTGYEIEHSASGKGQSGAIEVTTFIFYLDTDFKVVNHGIK